MAKHENYITLGMNLAIKSLDIPDADRMNEQEVRDWISENVGDDGKFFAQAADFWLEIDKEDGHEWRRWGYPESPWLIAKKAPRPKVVVWHGKCIERVGVQAMADKLKGKQNSVSVGALATLHKEHPYLVCPGLDRPVKQYKRVAALAGFVPTGMLERAYPDADMIDIEYLTIADALRRDWLDPDERMTWLRILRKLHELALDEMGEQFSVEYSELARQALMTDHVAGS